MSLNRVTDVFVSNGTAPVSAGSLGNLTNVTSGLIGLFGLDGKALTPGQTISDASAFYVAVGLSDGSLKRSMPIYGATINQYKGTHYATNCRQTDVIGYNRNTTVGSITANNSTEYAFNLLFASKKTLYSERPYRRSYRFTSSSSATQLNVAIQIFNAINNDAACEATAVIVGDGTTVTTTVVGGVTYTIFGGTAASNYGVEITSSQLTQFSNAYLEERPYFTTSIDPTTGFGAGTTKTNLATTSPGEGTYQMVYNLENFSAGYEGLQNRMIFPLQTPLLNATATAQTTTIVPTAAGTITRDVVTFSASVAGILAAGDKITINAANTYEIKYFIDSTHAVVTTPLLATSVTDAVTKNQQYDMLTIKFNNPNIEATASSVDSEQQIIIAAPAGISASAYNVQSAAVAGLLAILNPYMASVPRRFANVIL